MISATDRTKTLRLIPDVPRNVKALAALRTNGRAWSVGEGDALGVVVEIWSRALAAFGHPAAIARALELATEWDSLEVDRTLAEDLGARLDLRPVGASIHVVLEGEPTQTPNPMVSLVRSEVSKPLLSELERYFEGELNYATMRHGWLAYAIDGASVVGHAGCFQWTDHHGDIGVATHPAYRRRGIARAGAALVAGELRRSGRTPVWRTSPDNHPSMALAGALGFREVDRTVFIGRKPSRRGHSRQQYDRSVEIRASIRGVSPPRPWDLLLPLHKAWWAVLGVPLLIGLQWLTGWLATYPLMMAIGPFGVAVVLMTLAIRLVLVPLAIYQLRAARKSRHETARIQNLIGKDLEKLRKKYAKDLVRLNQESANLHQKHGLNPLAPAGAALKGTLLTSIVQGPILLAFLWAIRGFASSAAAPSLHFLWLASVAIPDPIFILPVLAALTTYLLSRATSKTAPSPTAADPSAADVQKGMSFLMPVIVGVSATFVPAALAVYWITGNLAAMLQQHLLASRLLG